MEEAAGIQEWELLNKPGGGLDVCAAADAFTGIEGEAEGAIKSDYFALSSEERYGQQAPSDGDREGDSPPDSDKPSWVDPGSNSAFLGESSRADPGGFWTSDESSDGQETGEVVELDGGVGQGGSDSGGIGETGVVVAGSEEFGGSPESKRGGSSDLGNRTIAEVGNAGWVWWKLPVELLKFCAFRIRPVWTISIAAALVGVVMLGRRLYRRKPKSKGFPLKVAVDDKKVSQLMVRATRLNEAFSAVKRMPMIRSTLPTAGVTPWPVVALR